MLNRHRPDVSYPPTFSPENIRGGQSRRPDIFGGYGGPTAQTSNHVGDAPCVVVETPRLPADTR